ncbi:DUF2493 domain-containing protein [Devosia sp. ZB163]|uniref:DUF2493 domain-containing protein n=1 Tax=Devosia sp. ZB163 TaxID=3025938 RepID=UPI0023611211|nr:DUF2493 domain-containing protein [Devosia sp. ZB163]MDC9823284.1 DUF2493 domain-containing protein [Devosia sp. ZB163]
MYDRDDIEHHDASPTAHIISELELHGWRPSGDDIDTRPMPEDYVLAGAISDVFDAMVSSFADTALDADLEELLWSITNGFHRAAARIERQLDDNEQSQRRLQQEQDGTEVKAVELERLLTTGELLIARRDALELMRDQAAEKFEHQTGSPWRPRNGSVVNHRALTSALVDSRDYLAARKRADTKVMLPIGPKIALTGGLDFNDHRLIWETLDKVHAKHKDMVLVHGGSAKGAELIAAKWADTQKISQIAFKPDWTAHGKAAPFRRNDQMLDIFPIGVLVFPGSGIQHNLRDKARKLGIPVWSVGGA